MTIYRPNILLILLFAIIYQPVFGQKQNYIDSLTKELNSANDLKKIPIYNALSWANKFSNPALAFEYGNNAYEISTKLKNENGQAISLNRMGAANLSLGELNASLIHLLKAVELSEKNNKKRILATSLRQIGEVYEAQGNLPEAIRYYYRSLGIADSIGKPIVTARSAIKVAGLYLKIKKYNNAKRYLEYVIDEFTKENYLRGLHEAYVLTGDYYFKQNNGDSALINYDIALSYLTKLKDKQGYAITSSKIANILEEKGLYKEAIAGYLNALDTFKIIDDKKNIVHSYIRLAGAYSGDKRSKKAIYYGNLALEQAILLNLPNEEKEANFILYLIFKNINNQGTAISYLENYMHLMDSLQQGQESWRVEQLRKSFDLESQIKENKLNTAIINNQALIIKNNVLVRNFLVVLIIVIFLLAGTIWYALKHAKSANEQLKIANEEKNEAISLISHDLKSPFNKIKGLIHIISCELNGNEKEIMDLLSKINMVTQDGLNLVQNLVDIKALSSGSYIIKLTKFELNEFLVKRVQGFEQIAQSKNIELDFEPSVTTSEVNSDINSLARIFDNLLSNAIKFSPKGEKVTIVCSVEEGNFTFSITDNGRGISQKEINRIFNKYETGLALPTGNEVSSGLGLTIVSSLIHKLGGTIKCISELNKGATFIVSLPQKEELTK